MGFVALLNRDIPAHRSMITGVRCWSGARAGNRLAALIALWAWR